MNRKLEVLLLESNIEMDHMLSSSDLAVFTVLRMVENETLLLALSAASDFARKRVLSVVSERAQQMLVHDLDAVGSVPMEDRIQAQQRLIGLFHSIPGLKFAQKKLH